MPNPFYSWRSHKFEYSQKSLLPRLRDLAYTESMTVGLKVAADELHWAREAEREAHSRLVRAVKAAALEHGAGKGLARLLGISPQYLCDIRAGRRAVSDEVLAKMRKSKR